jgi:hypothetical protein
VSLWVLSSSEGKLFCRFVLTEAHDDAAEPVNLASLSTRLRADLGSGVSDSNWFGFGSFTRTVHSLGLPNLRVSQHFMWDDRRHAAPQSTAAPCVALPEPVDQLVDQPNLPPLWVPLWSAAYQTLSDYMRDIGST